MKRTGEKGEGKFERITWEEAIDEIASTLKEQKEKYGPESLGILSPQAYAVIQSLGRRFLNVHGSPNYMHSAICAMQRAASKVISIGKPSDTLPGQLDKTKLLVVWGRITRTRRSTAAIRTSAWTPSRTACRLSTSGRCARAWAQRPTSGCRCVPARIWRWRWPC